MLPRAVLASAIALAVASAALVACGLSLGGLSAAPDASGGGSQDATVAPLDAQPAADAGAGDARRDSGSGDESDDAGDAALDVAIDAGPCNGLRCNGACLADASDCRACDGGPLLCAVTGACGATCAACGDHPIQCFNCDSNRQNPVGTCELVDANAYCLNGGNYPDDHCQCDNKNDPAPCPGQTQTCASIDFFGTIACATCGEPGTDGLACRGGGACVEADASCR